MTARKVWIKGFTLIEVILVMTIIGILAGIFMANVFSSLERGRDSRRKQDLRSVTQALELYYTDLGRYPDDLPAGGDPFTHPDNTDSIYLQKTPVDPSSGIRYCYETDGGWYRLVANLENENDPDVLSSPTSCSGTNYNYGVSSPNINL